MSLRISRVLYKRYKKRKLFLKAKEPCTLSRLYKQNKTIKKLFMQYWQEKIKIGSLQFPRFIGGPLDGITDSPFRKLVREFSPEELLYTEMRHVGTIANQTGGVLALNFEQLERPLSYQIAANKEDFIEAACEKILAKGVDIVDLNIGCPARNVVNSGSGSALMADAPRLKKILTKIRSCLPIPFTLKIRAGFKEKNALAIAQLAQDCGVDALALHPRLQTEFFLGRPDYAYAAQVILSGNIVNWATAKLAYEQTGADGFLIGRGIWARPWKLSEMRAHSKGQVYQPTTDLIISSALKHFHYTLAYYGPRGLYNFRKHFPFYVRGLTGAAQLRKSLVVAESAEDVVSLLQSTLG
jgi:tRNA-dihydrouridine synthase B